MIDRPLQEQINELIAVLSKNKFITEILDSSPFPQNIPWYLGAGCICQSVWNYFSGMEITNGIKDYDLVYYNANDISKKSEIAEQKRIKKKFSDLPVDIDVVNEARVHLWFKKDFGKKIGQLKSCEDAINSWPATATAVGVNKTKGKINVYAPYGLNDLFGMVVRPNKPSVIRWVYEKKVKKWTKKWPNLQVVPWRQI